MTQEAQQKQLITIGIIAAYATLAFVGTTIIRVPLPATGGYFNLGDTFVMAAALLHGPLIGGAVGLIGPALSDAIGFPQFILATAVVKGIEGIMVGLVGTSLRRNGSSSLRVIMALILGIIILVAGYYVFEAMIYPALAKSVPFYGVTDAKAALAEIVPNLLQGVLSAVIAFGIWRIFIGVRK
ncbi:MAG: ECF transporter S component [Thermodesulfobacteriota bacterium]|nr:ECF transporter S component [Thermodesulfobacteriota bacterium]